MNFYLADDCEPSFTSFANLVGETEGWHLVGSSTNFEAFTAELFQFEPDVILTSIAFLALLDDAQREQISGTLPRSVMLAISDTETLDELRAALKLGARDLLAAGRDKDYLRRAIERAVSDQARRTEYLLKQAPFASSSDTPSAAIPAPALTQPAGQIVPLLRAKGGVGQTFVACHLCAALASFSRANVALVDLSTPCGDLTTLLNPPAEPRQPTYADLIPIIDELDQANVEAALWTHPAGFRVLLSPPGFTSENRLPEDFLERVLALLADRFDIVVLDTPRSPNALADTAVRQATTAFLVLTPDVTAVRNTQLLVERLLSTGLSRDGLKLILNRSERRGPLGPDQLEKGFGLPVAAALAADRGAAARFENDGQLLTECTELDVVQGVLELAGQLYPFEKPPRRTWLTRLRRVVPDRVRGPVGPRNQ